MQKLSFLIVWREFKKINLTTDFSEKSYIIYLEEKIEPDSFLYQVQFTGYEEIGINYHLERSQYDSFMLTYTISGTHNIIYDGKYYKVKPDTLMFIDCLKPHETWGDKDGYTILYMHIINPYLTDFCNNIHTLHSPIIPLDGDKIGFKNLVYSLHTDLKNGTFDKIEYSKKIYALLLDLNNFVKSNTIKSNNMTDYLNNLINYISTNYNKKLDLKTCAKIARVSPNHLEATFKKFLNISVAKHISLIRLKEAQRLLITTKHSVLQIAEMVGFLDSQALIRLFKTYIGITPLAYRKLYYKE